MEKIKGATIGFIGRSGCGKGTQIKLLEEFLTQQGNEVCVVGLGAFGRKLAAEHTLMGEWIKKIIDQGLQYPDWLASSFIVQALHASLKNKDQVLILDGSPRRLAEAKVIDELLAALGRASLMPIHLEIREATARARLMSRGREDDTAEAIAVRLSWFSTEVMPVIEYYGSRIVTINAEQEIEKTQEEVRNKILNA